MDNVRIASGFCLLALTLAACAGPSEEPAPETAPAPDTQPRNGRTLAIPGSTSSPQPGSGSGTATRLVWEAPKQWSEEAPSSNMRLAQYRVSGPGGDAECVVYYFGPGQGGDPASNATRWANQFAQPDGRPSTDVMTVSPLEGTSVQVDIVEVTGIYDGGMSGPVDAKDYMLLGGIARGPDAPWFFKFIGPESTVNAERQTFLAMMRSIQTDG
jgi:hypothetical protein